MKSELLKIANTGWIRKGPRSMAGTSFPPAAAWLTKGQVPGSYGRLIRDYVVFPKDEPKMDGEKLAGKIVYVDHFGNVISNITSADLQTFRSVTKREIRAIDLGDLSIKGLKTHYSEGATGLPEALINSNGQLEVFVKQGRAVDYCQVQVGDRIAVL